ncbi:hypothetical protein [Pelagicoccus mobilis]|uniref:Fibronectin type-III domain-containing protein n=1 Tax=Pelagicoccus mobilis TaxID=415221 RepID=A0A934VQJ1_9BACT|nr:hypothetical protein [Pelagicoccus mobilis]MBK1878407.1 hypothetical protein [Pelagicoccus mobilis]
MKKSLLSLLACGALCGSAFGAKISFSLDIESLSNAGGTEQLSNQGLLVLIVSTEDEVFQSPVADTIVTGDDQIVATWDLNKVGPGTTDIALFEGGIDYQAEWEGGPLALVWFPGLSEEDMTPETDEPFGFFSDANNLVSGHSWRMPAPGSLLHSLKLFTQSATKLVQGGGDVPDGIGAAAYLVGTAPTAPTAPTEISFEPKGTTIEVTWEGGSAGSGGYLVQRKGDGDPNSSFETIGIVNAGDPNKFIDPNVIPGAKYDYKLISLSGIGFASADQVEDFIEALRSRIIAFDSRAKMMSGINKRTIDLSVTGSEELPVLLQAIGPSLHDSGFVPQSRDIPADAALELYYGIKPADVTDRKIAENDEWDLYEDRDLIEDVMRDYGAYPMYNHPGSGDSAFLALVKEVAGGYTAPVFDPMGGEGVAVVGIYDVNYKEENPSETRLTGVASRSFVGEGFENFRSSVNILGQVPMTLLIRGQGPWLRDLSENDAFNSDVVLDNPTVTLFRLVSGKWEEVATNDDWGTANSASVAQIHAASDAVGLPRLTEGSADSAMLLTVEPGIYQAIMDGVDGETGVAQIAIFEVPGM